VSGWQRPGLNAGRCLLGACWVQGLARQRVIRTQASAGQTNGPSQGGAHLDGFPALWRGKGALVLAAEFPSLHHGCGGRMRGWRRRARTQSWQLRSTTRCSLPKRGWGRLGASCPPTWVTAGTEMRWSTQLRGRGRRR
jgi:hypothetical protein